MTLRTGSVCTGYGGLDEAVQEVFGGELAWVSDIDPGACQIIAHRMPGVPNLGNLRFIHWLRTLRQYGPIDVLCGGYPCQPFSLAGELKGTADARHLWPLIACALRVLRPRYAIFENVANHLRLGFDTVLADLADLGFDAEWVVVRADEVGAPHQRRRLFVLATASDAQGTGLSGEGLRGWAPKRSGPLENADSATRGERGLPTPGQTESRGARPDTRGRGGTPSADAEGCSWGVSHGDRPTAAHATGIGWEEGGPESAGQQGGLGASVSGGAASAHPKGGSRQNGAVGDRAVQLLTEPGAGGRVGQRGDTEGTGASGEGASVLEWGQFAPAVARWEAATGRRAPRATDDRSRLSPAFVEWMMGLPAGHVTEVPGLTRTAQLKALGNGVVPQQAAAAIRLLAERAGLAA